MTASIVPKTSPSLNDSSTSGNSKNILNNSNSNYGLLVNSGINQDFVYLPNSIFNNIHYDNQNTFKNFLLPNSYILNQYSNFISYNNQNININK